MDLDCSDGVNSGSFCIISKRYRYLYAKEAVNEAVEEAGR